MIDPISLVVGAGLLAAGFLAGHLTARRSARRRPDGPQEPVCGCTHHRALHDPETGECHERVKVPLGGGGGYSWELCLCRQYVGPEPIGSMWVPPVAIESEDR
jgi:hypothetical protein